MDYDSLLWSRNTFNYFITCVLQFVSFLWWLIRRVSRWVRCSLQVLQLLPVASTCQQCHAPTILTTCSRCARSLVGQASNKCVDLPSLAVVCVLQVLFVSTIEAVGGHFVLMTNEWPNYFGQAASGNLIAHVTFLGPHLVPSMWPSNTFSSSKSHILYFT